MNIYIAGASKEIHVAQTWILAYKAIGLRITHDWTIDVMKNVGKDVLPLELVKYANQDYDAVIEAELFWMLTSEKSSRGMHTELGIALGNGIPVVVSGPDWKNNIFCYMADYQFPTHELAFEFIRSWEKDVE